MKILYTRYAKYRLPEFAVETQIIEKDNKKYVVKRAQNPAAIPHIKKFGVNAELLKDIYGDLLNVCNVNIENDEAIFNYIEGKSLSQLLYIAIEDGDDNAVKDLINLYLSFLKGKNNEFIPFYPTDEYYQIFGSDFNFDKSIPAFKVSNLDIGPSNLIFSDTKFTVIDYEWVYAFPIPKDFVYFRNLCVLLFYSEINLGKYIDFSDLCDELDIKMDLNILNKMNISFHQSIYGKDDNSEFKKEDFNKLLKPSVRVDNGAFGGFCTVNFNCIDIDGNIPPQVFEINDNVIDLRFYVPTICSSIVLNFNITEGISIVKDIRLVLCGKIYKPNIHNGSEIDGYYIFNEPPVFTFFDNFIVGEVCILGSITNFINTGSNLNYDTVVHLVSENIRKDERIKNLGEQNNLLKTQSVLLNAINNSEVWKSVKKIKNVKKKAKSILKPNFKPNPSLLDCRGGIIPIWWEFKEYGVKIRDGLTYNIDYFEYTENKLYLKGFIFSEILNIEDAYLLITDGDNNTELPINYGVLREDVAQHFNKHSIANSGFYVKYFLSLLKTVEMWLVLKNGDGMAHVYLGQIGQNSIR